MNADARTGAPPAGEDLELADLVEYSDGSVVSRTLMSGKAGTLTAFAFDAGEGLSEHSAPYDAFVQVLDGSGVFTIAERPHELKAGQGILMPASIPHAVRAGTRMKMMLTMFRG